MSTASRLRRERAAGIAGGTGSSRTPGSRRAAPPEPTLRARARYAFDSSMSSGPSALIWYLGCAVVCVVILFAAVVLIFGAGPTHNPITALYNVLLHTIDTGTQANDSGTLYSTLDLLVTIAGIFIFSAFIGVLATGIDARLQNLRKGRSLVLERNHTLVLGWSESIFTILSELANANETRRSASIVVLAERDKVEMEDAIRERLPDLRGTKVVCRTGNPIAVKDLALVNHREARSVIVVAPEGRDPDAMVIKTILALTRGPDRREAPYHIVTEVQSQANIEAARLAGGEEAVILDKALTVSRLIVQTSRQSGAALVYQELLDFDGDEVYMRADERLTGQTYGDVLLAYENCAVIGIRDAAGDVKLNPPMATVFGPGDMVIAIAEDDSVLEAAPPLAGIVDEEEYAHPGSRVDVVAAEPPTEREFVEDAGPAERVAVSIRAGDTTDRDLLDRLEVGEFDRVIVMCDAGTDPQHADARVLITLLHLRDIAQRTGAEFTIVSEILDEADRELAEVAKVDDVIVSDQVISYMLAQISENRDLAEVFDELFSAEGSEVYLRPVSDYVDGAGEATFATLVAAARRRDESAIGYRVAAETDEPGFGVHVNPRKARTFATAPDDRLIVLAEN